MRIYLCESRNNQIGWNNVSEIDKFEILQKNENVFFYTIVIINMINPLEGGDFMTKSKQSQLTQSKCVHHEQMLLIHISTMSNAEMCI